MGLKGANAKRYLLGHPPTWPPAKGPLGDQRARRSHSSFLRIKSPNGLNDESHSVFTEGNRFPITADGVEKRPQNRRNLLGLEGISILLGLYEF
jgi:hypothetical protein